MASDRRTASVGKFERWPVRQQIDFSLRQPLPVPIHRKRRLDDDNSLFPHPRTHQREKTAKRRRRHSLARSWIEAGLRKYRESRRVLRSYSGYIERSCGVSFPSARRTAGEQPAVFSLKSSRSLSARPSPRRLIRPPIQNSLPYLQLNVHRHPRSLRRAHHLTHQGEHARPAWQPVSHTALSLPNHLIATHRRTSIALECACNPSALASNCTSPASCAANPARLICCTLTHFTKTPALSPLAVAPIPQWEALRSLPLGGSPQAVAPRKVQRRRSLPHRHFFRSESASSPGRLRCSRSEADSRSRMPG